MKKLKLNRETLHTLTDAKVETVNGGVIVSMFCPTMGYVCSPSHVGCTSRCPQ